MTQPTLSIITVNFNNNKGLIATLNSIKNHSHLMNISLLMRVQQMEAKKQL